MKLVPPETLFLPEKGSERIVCGTTIAEWDYAVVYVHQKNKPYDPPTHMYFTFYGNGDYRLDEIAKLTDQWTYRRGECHHTFAEGSHEFFRAKKMACQIVATYRRKYLAEHGQPPNPLCLAGTLDENLVRRKMRDFYRERSYGQQFALELDEPDLKP